MKYYHSNNGVFMSELSTDTCKEEGQSQSCIGVGAQHQNREAEICIQTMVYMARSFMVHCDLHWDEHRSDNLALWSIALDHAAGLYNNIP